MWWCNVPAVRCDELIMKPLIIWPNWRVPSFTQGIFCLLSQGSACQKMLFTFVFMGIINNCYSQWYAVKGRRRLMGLKSPRNFLLLWKLRTWRRRVWFSLFEETFWIERGSSWNCVIQFFFFFVSFVPPSPRTLTKMYMKVYRRR